MILSFLLSIYCVFQTSHTVVRPLRVLNARMNEILQSNNLNDALTPNQNDEETCREIKELQEQFSNLMSDYKFTNNELMNQDNDVIALIELA